MKHLLHLAAVAPIGVCCAISLADLPPLPAGAINAGAQLVNRYGNEYVVIPGGNASYNGADHRGNPFYFGSNFDGEGSVPYAFGIARTETTIAQWTEFVNAYSPYWSGASADLRLLGFNIARDAEGRFYHDPRVAHVPIAGVSWLAAATYCNWLSNDKRVDRSAFETGAYDLRGINIAAPVSRTTPIEQNMNAQFRLPTIAEWYKAGYYDPNRRGPSAGGWWLYPNCLDRPLIAGLPGGTAETSAGIWSQIPFGEFIGVASYTGQSPWGLFDISGGVGEFTTTSNGVVNGREFAVVVGSYVEGATISYDDAIARSRGSVPILADTTVYGVRIVSTIPSTTVSLPSVVLLVALRRNRR